MAAAVRPSLSGLACCLISFFSHRRRAWRRRTAPHLSPVSAARAHSHKYNDRPFISCAVRARVRRSPRLHPEQDTRGRHQQYIFATYFPVEARGCPANPSAMVMAMLVVFSALLLCPSAGAEQLARPLEGEEGERGHMFRYHLQQRSSL